MVLTCCRFTKCCRQTQLPPPTCLSARCCILCPSFLLQYTKYSEQGVDAPAILGTQVLGTDYACVSLFLSCVAIVQIENRTCLGLTLATLPGVKVRPFYLASMDVPDPFDPPAMWKRAVGMRDGDSPSVDTEGLVGEAGEAGVGEPIFMVYATPQSIDSLGDYMAGMDATFPRSQKIGAIASTVSRCTSRIIRRGRVWCRYFFACNLEPAMRCPGHFFFSLCPSALGRPRKRKYLRRQTPAKLPCLLVRCGYHVA